MKNKKEKNENNNNLLVEILNILQTSKHCLRMMQDEADMNILDKSGQTAQGTETFKH